MQIDDYQDDTELLPPSEYRRGAQVTRIIFLRVTIHVRIPKSFPYLLILKEMSLLT